MSGKAMYSCITEVKDSYDLPSLPFAQDALEPQMDAMTVRVHYEGHHQAYQKKLNAALEEWRKSGETSELAKKSILHIIRNVHQVPQKFFKAIRNNGGGFVNHDMFFALLGKGSPQPTGQIKEDIDSVFGSFDAFKEQFTAAALGVFGSGYAWLSRDSSNKLAITTSVNQESAITEGLKPVLVIDVWEHAYYLKYQNRRPEFVKAWWDIINWDAVTELDEWWKTVTAI